MSIVAPLLHPLRTRPEWQDRFWGKVFADPLTSECWLWTASTINGYGQFNRSDWGTARSHRLAYLWVHGSIPDGLVLDHLCRVRHCVNPEHLEPVSNRENILRGISGPALNARVTHCKRGHEFTPENTYSPPAGGRQCLACMRLNSRASTYKRSTYGTSAAGLCASCGRLLSLRQNGTLHKHLRFEGGTCPGSGLPAVEKREAS